MRLSFSPPHTHHCHYHYHYPIRFHHSTRMDAPTRKDKVIVIMGATGSGKSRLSVDLATLFPFSEIINSDKMQVYRGLDITTNKIPFYQRRGVPHHLLGDVEPSLPEFSPSDFRRRAADTIADITRRKKLPILVGGSNSFVHALLVQRFDPEFNVFDDVSSSSSSSPSSFELRYKCCFLWVDISFPVLLEYLLKRVDDMVDSGMVDELAQFFDPDAANRTGFGLRKAIGVPEFDRFFKEYPPGQGREGKDPMRERAYQEAVRAIKDNTCKLAKRQIGKILRLQSAGWDLRRIDATEAFRAVLTSDSHGGSDAWERQVLQPSVNIVKRFLME
ncbi:adenylate isopentenyltransferase-like [Abrus precatorius]|uniref:adenylate dimethylallyltransferase (ADP/ATP-dependent) n=1 Tax=Abrus precatorius TaxID=3816 RepID=A0A8B8MID3_ABRPR|nr:adenylate isopentenyltransferase-like [Abrus precatorius]